MNIQELRQSLKMKWLNYYQQNRPWLVKMRVWATYAGLRRPSSGFILATLSVLEPEFDQILAFVMELNNNPDEIVAALGLNFNPDKELGLVKLQTELAVTQHIPEYPAEPPGELRELTVQDAPPMLAQAENGENGVVMSRLQPPVWEVVGNRQSLTRAIANSATMNLNSKVESASPSRQLLAVTLEIPRKDRPLTPLTLTPIKPHNGKVVSALEITTEVPGKPKTLISPKLVTKISQNKHYLHQAIPTHKVVNLREHTNASNLASWVDEFCLGTGWNSEEAVSM